MAKWPRLEAEGKTHCSVYRPRQVVQEVSGTENRRWWEGRDGGGRNCPTATTNHRFKYSLAVYGLNAHSSAPPSSETEQAVFTCHSRLGRHALVSSFTEVLFLGASGILLVKVVWISPVSVGGEI